MEKIYYSPKGYWKGYAAAEKLAKAAGVKESVARAWLKKQPIWQIYLPRPKFIPQAKFDITRPNEAHQADLLFLPHDKGYKYALTVIDVASRYKAARPLKTKQASEVAKAFVKIYAGELNFPKILMVDPGREFMGETKKILSANGTTIRMGRVNVHKDQAMVERFNRTLAERLFSYQYDMEMEPTEMSKGERNTTWVDRLQAVVKAINNETTRLTGIKPVDAINLLEVKSQPSTPYHRPVGKEEKQLPIGTTVRFLYEPGEAEGDHKNRATDPIWSVTTHTVEKVLVKPEQPVLYYVSDRRRGYVREELQTI